MLKKKTNTAIFLAALLAGLGMILSACGGPAAAPAPVITEIREAGETPVLEAPGEELGLDQAGTSLEGINVCELIPPEDVAAITGPLREDETEPDISLDREVGCAYHDQAGHWYYLTYYPLDQWALAEYTLPDPETLPGVLDGALLGRYSDSEVNLEALVKGELVIGAHVSQGGQDTALVLVQLAYTYRPK